MFLPDIKNMISILYTEDRKKSISKTLIITRDIDRDQGCISLGKILIRILNPKTDFSFLWQNPKRDYESNESVPDEDSID